MPESLHCIFKLANCCSCICHVRMCSSSILQVVKIISQWGLLQLITTHWAPVSVCSWMHSRSWTGDDPMKSYRRQIIRLGGSYATPRNMEIRFVYCESMKRIIYWGDSSGTLIGLHQMCQSRTTRHQNGRPLFTCYVMQAPWRREALGMKFSVPLR